jgi:SAM domain (Sterile alpha motif)
MDVVVWLRGPGLGKYEAAFRENDIDETILPGLTHETLKELGVASVGHRVKLLDAIAALRSGASGKAPSVDAGTTSSTASAPFRRPRRAPSSHGDVLGPCGLNGALGPHGP